MSTAILENEDTALTVMDGSQAIQLFNEMGHNVTFLLEAIPTLPDDELKLLLQVSEQAQRQSWVIRGAVALEVISRIHKRTGDLKTADGTLKEIARETGVAVATLRDDARVVSVFGVDTLRGEMALEREFYRLSASLDDPQATIEMVYSKMDRGEGYSTRDFREDIKEMRNGKSLEQVDTCLRVGKKLSPETSVKVRKYLDETGQPIGEVVEAAMLAFVKG